MISVVSSGIPKFEKALEWQKKYLYFAGKISSKRERTAEEQRAHTMIAQVNLDHAESLKEEVHRQSKLTGMLREAQSAIEESLRAIEQLKELSSNEKEIATMECRARINMGICCMLQGKIVVLFNLIDFLIFSTTK